jgi:serine/threonine protein kinase/WD40 repeat protein
MGICPKCNSKVKAKATRCPKCGAALNLPTPTEPIKQPPAEGKKGTMSASEFLSELAESAQPVHGDEIKTETPSVQEGQGPSDARKTVEAADMAPPMGDEIATSTKPGSTIEYEDLDKKAATGESGSDGQLQRVWKEAIGSSAKDSKQSLRHDRAEASDSVFRRVAVRQVADASSPNLQTADYQVRDKLGEGGMGIVYSANQTAVNRIVALKTIKSEKSKNETSRRQFFYEAEITADLDHPNIPPIYELGTTEDQLLFYSMKLIQGVEWQKIISKKSRSENLEIYTKMADAVAFAHSRNIIHRDLKPDNVLLGAYGEVYVTDWGLAVNLAKRKSIDFGGTPDYMAPEMAANRRESIGKASDVYVLGAILYQIVTGTPPHVGHTPLDRLRAASRNEIVPTDVDDPLLEIAYRAMAADPMARYPSVAEMQRAIGQILRHSDSIALAGRADDLVTSALVSKDYDSFTRGIHAYKDALDMWGENKLAATGLKRARMAFGQCAFDKGDYDLAVQTLDRNHADEARLYEKASKAKLGVVQRERRYKTLWQSFIGALVLFLAVASGLAGFAWMKRNEAVAQTAIAQENETKATNNEAKANQNFEEAEKQRMLAEKNEATAKKNFEEAEKQRMLAEKNEAEARENEAEAKKNFEEAEKQRMLAEANERKANENFRVAEQQRRLAEQRAAQVSIGEMDSNISLAKLQAEEGNVRGADLIRQLLTDKLSATQETFQGKAPKLKSWAWNRLENLSNADLPKLPLAPQSVVTAVDFAAGKYRGVSGTGDGKFQWLEFQRGRLMPENRGWSIEQGKVNAVAIAPSGDEAIFSVERGESFENHTWSHAEKEPVKIDAAGNRSFQSFAYSPDGQYVAAGLNQGIWIWKRASGWAHKSPDLVVESVRGSLIKMDWINAKQLLATARLNQQTNVHLVDAGKPKDQPGITLEIPAEWKDDLRTTAHWQGNQILFGGESGRIFVGSLGTAPATANPGEPVKIGLTNVVELPKKHLSGITRMITRDGQSLVSISNEPVAHVWRRRPDGGIDYDTHLSNIPTTSEVTTNVSLASFVDNDRIAGITSDGVAFVWDVPRQKQRRVLTRVSEKGEPESYTSPVIQVFSTGTNPNAVAVNTDGVVDLWILQTGLTQKIDGQRFSYFGHTPGAQLVDTAVDMQSRVVVTTASLGGAKEVYNPNRHDREFCVWDHATGNMLHRWTESAPDQLEPRITILKGGKELMIASEKSTRIVTLDGNKVFQKDNLGTYFAVPNPRNPSLLAMVKRSGYTWLWDRANEASWQDKVFYADAGARGIPLRGVWSDDGQRLYTIYSSGAIFSFAIRDGKLEPTWSSAKIEDEKSELWKAVVGSNHQVRLHSLIDLAVARKGDQEHLYAAIRETRADPSTSLLELQFPVAGTAAGQPKLVQFQRLAGQFWIEAQPGKTPAFETRIHPLFAIKPSTDSIVGKLRSGEHTFLSTKGGRVMELKDTSKAIASFGRWVLSSASSDRELKQLLTLHNDGSVWRMSLEDPAKPAWSKTPIQAEGFDEIRLSPDASLIALLDRDSGSLRWLDAKTGTVQREAKGVQAMAWDPLADASLAVCHDDGGLELIHGQVAQPLPKLTLASEGKFSSVTFFNENWNDPQVASARYLLVQSEDESSGKLHFVPLSAPAQPDQRIFQIEIKRGLTVTSSPVDSLFVTGDDAGNVAVRTAYPTWNQERQLFDLKGHLGGRIECIAFSGDGQALITSDDKYRLLAWLSRDDTLAP